MLDAGFSTLAYLKSRILPAAAEDVLDYDEAIQRLGLGVAGRFNAFCNRVFQRVTGQQDEFHARSTAIVLRAYPVETINSVQIRAFDGTLDTHDAGYQLDQLAGLILFQSAPGDATERIVIDYDGGYYLADGGTQPAGSTALPHDLLEAYVMQAQAWAEARNLFGTISLDKDRSATGSALQLSKEVAAMLEPHRRYSTE